MKNAENTMKLYLPSLSVNESMARQAVASFVAQLNPTIEELADIKCAVSEAVTNAIVHGYKGSSGMVEMKCRLKGQEIEIDVIDKGCGIEDIPLAMQPLYSGSEEEERSGMGFTVMQSFMDSLKVISEVGVGTTVSMSKKVGVLFDD